MVEPEVIGGVMNLETQIGDVPRFGDVRKNFSFVDGAHHGPEVRVPGAENARRARVLSDPGQQLVARHTGHALIGQHDRDFGVFFRHSQRFFGLVGGRHLELWLQQIFERDEDLSFVIHHEHAGWTQAR
jgi:hypothetical protein